MTKVIANEAAKEADKAKPEPEAAPELEVVLYKLRKQFFHKGVLHPAGGKVYLPKGSAPRGAVEVKTVAPEKAAAPTKDEE